MAHNDTGDDKKKRNKEDDDPYDVTPGKRNTDSSHQTDGFFNAIFPEDKEKNVAKDESRGNSDSSEKSEPKSHMTGSAEVTERSQEKISPKWESMQQSEPQESKSRSEMVESRSRSNEPVSKSTMTEPNSKSNMVVLMSQEGVEPKTCVEVFDNREKTTEPKSMMKSDFIDLNPPTKAEVKTFKTSAERSDNQERRHDKKPHRAREEPSIKTGKRPKKVLSDFDDKRPSDTDDQMADQVPKKQLQSKYLQLPGSKPPTTPPKAKDQASAQPKRQDARRSTETMESSDGLPQKVVKVHSQGPKTDRTTDEITPRKKKTAAKGEVKVAGPRKKPTAGSTRGGAILRKIGSARDKSSKSRKKAKVTKKQSDNSGRKLKSKDNSARKNFRAKMGLIAKSTVDKIGKCFKVKTLRASDDTIHGPQATTLEYVNNDDELANFKNTNKPTTNVVFVEPKYKGKILVDGVPFWKVKIPGQEIPHRKPTDLYSHQRKLVETGQKGCLDPISSPKEYTPYLDNHNEIIKEREHFFSKGNIFSNTMRGIMNVSHKNVGDCRACTVKQKREKLKNSGKLRSMPTMLPPPPSPPNTDGGEIQRLNFSNECEMYSYSKLDLSLGNKRPVPTNFASKETTETASTSISGETSKSANSVDKVKRPEK